jgi:hypothetical protein
MMQKLFYDKEKMFVAKQSLSLRDVNLQVALFLEKEI